MNEIIAYLILLFLGCVIFSICYWQIFYPVILKRVQFHLFELRDESRSLAAQQGLVNSFVYQDMERFICKTLALTPNINFLSLLWFTMNHANKIDNSEYERFSKEAPREFLNIRDSTSRDAVIIMMLNSPWEIILLALPLPVLWVLGKISRTGIYRKTESFLENVESDREAPSPAGC